VRPVNLIPPEERRGENAPMRTGPLAYVVVGVLAVALVAATFAVMTSNQISDKKTEKATLEAQVADAQAQADQVKSFADFAAVQQAREETVSTLAQSRFDWERVLRELAIVIPGDVWITGLNATVSADAASALSTSSASAGSGASDSITAPSLEIQGCAGGHEAVARFLAVVHDIDGVTRATVISSDRPNQTSPAGAASTASAGSSSGSQACSSRNFVSTFDLAVAFDAAQLGAPSGSSTTTPTTSTTPSTSSATSQPTAAGTSASGDQSQASDANQQLQQQKDSAAQKSAKGRKAVATFIPGAGSAP
jgi:Tfp pilus assembly protein PilN